MIEQESAFKKKVLDQFLSVANLIGKNGVFARVQKRFLELSLNHIDG
jgi:putative transposase